jgi:hypothetical protein
MKGTGFSPYVQFLTRLGFTREWNMVPFHGQPQFRSGPLHRQVLNVLRPNIRCAE